MEMFDRLVFETLAEASLPCSALRLAKKLRVDGVQCAVLDVRHALGRIGRLHRIMVVWEPWDLVPRFRLGCLCGRLPN
jgi:hypothetical protein